ncbi:WD40-repeat-containing domain protein [Schizophyllum commune]
MSGGNMYNHRSLQPSAPGQTLPGAPRGFSLSARLDEHLDLIRQDYEIMATELTDARAQKEELETKVVAQINEIALITNTLHELNSKHARLRQTYEQEVTALRAQLHEAQRQHFSSPAIGPGVPVSMPAKLAAPGPSTPQGQLPPQLASERGTPRGPPGAAPLPSAPPPAALPPPAGMEAGPNAAAPPPPLSSGPSFLDDLDPATLPPELKKDGSDWWAVFNPNTKRVLDVSLKHSLIHETVVCCVRFSADGKFLATGCNRTAQIFDVQTGRKTCVLVDEGSGRAGDLYIRSVCFSPDGKYLATGAEDRQIRIWDIAKKSIKHIFDGHQQEIYSLEFSYDGRLIVSGSGDKTARIWDMQDGTSKVLAINDQDSLNADAGVTSVAISPDGRLVAAGSLDTAVRIWDVESGVLLERLRGHRDSVYSVAFTPDGKGLISGSLDKTLKYWDVSGLARGAARRAPGRGGDEKNSLCTMNFTGHKDYVLSVAVSPDGQWVVSGSKDRGVQFWDSRTAVVQCMLQGHKNSVISIDLSPAGGMLATGSGDWHARICE